MKSIYPLS